MYEARYWGILSAYTILSVQAGFIHVVCLGISNKSVAVPREGGSCCHTRVGLVCAGGARSGAHPHHTTSGFPHLITMPTAIVNTVLPTATPLCYPWKPQ